MKILLTTHQFFPEFGAGTEVLTRAVAREMRRRGHEVRLLTGFPSTPGSEVDNTRCENYEYEGILVYRFRHAYEPMGGQSSKLEVGFDNHLASEFFSRILDDFRPDIVHFFHFNRLGTGMVDVAVAAGVSAWFTPTDFWAACVTAQLRDQAGAPCAGPSAHSGNCALHLSSQVIGGAAGRLVGMLPDWGGDVLVRAAGAGLLGKHRLVRELHVMGERLPRNIRRLNRLQGIVAPNWMMADFLAGQGVRRDLIHVSPFGIELDGSRLATEGRSPTSGPLRVGYIGTLLEHKGVHVLLAALGRLPQGLVETRVYGSVDESPHYMALLRVLAAKAGKVEFCGTFPNQQIAEVLAEMDVLVIPSVWNENTPLVLYAAQAARCPVIASDVPGLAEVLRDGEDSLLFKTGDDGALASKLLQVALDRSLLQLMTQAVRPPPNISAYCDDLLALWAQDQPR